MVFWYIDPYTYIAMSLAYIVSYITLLAIAAKIAPHVASKFSSKFSLYGSMAISSAIVFIGGFAAIYLLAVILVNVFDITPGFIVTLVILILAMNIISYLISPFMINAFYGAKHDPEIQRIVDDVARKAGFRNPPKAVVVEGPPNAFAYGNFLSGKYVAITTGMLDIVNRGELEAVIGHELGHHKHRDNTILLLMGIIPSILYFLGVTLVRIGLFSGYSSRRREGEGGLILLLIGVAAIVFSMIIQIIVLAFSRLREYYADAHGVWVAGPQNMQRSLAKIHLYYERYRDDKQVIDNSKLKTLFIYAFIDAVANPYISYHSMGYSKIDHVIDRLKRVKVNPITEILSTHPPIPKRLAFIEKVVVEHIRA